MKKIICKKEYDTEAASIVYKNAVGSFGDPDGYEETLYQMPDGSYFLYTNGGADSPYREEKIARMSAKSAEIWLSQHR